MVIALRLLALFFTYAFIGWCLEVCYAAATTRKFVNRGFLNGPICPIYGCGMMAVVLCLSTLSNNLPMLFLGSTTLATVMEYLTGLILEKLFHMKWWDYSHFKYNLQGYVCLRFSLIWGIACTVVMKVIHPLILFTISLIPLLALEITLSLFALTFLVDLAATVAAIHQLQLRLERISDAAVRLHGISDSLGESLFESTERAMAATQDRRQALDQLRVQQQLNLYAIREKSQQQLGNWKDRGLEGLDALRARQEELLLQLYLLLRDRRLPVRRLIRAFPTLQPQRHKATLAHLRYTLDHPGKTAEIREISDTISAEAAEASNPPVFAQGFNRYKLFWIFLIGALLGDGVETLFCLGTTGKLMNRSSVLYGPFSIVWGVGAVLLTVTLHKLSGKSDRYIFVAGSVIGGLYEYSCSIFTEWAFGSTFWDYSHLPFNLHGRVNLLFCFFWGIAALIWVKNVYPRLSHLVERIPLRAGRPLTIVLAVGMAVNLTLSAAALIRYSDRTAGVAPANAADEWLDEHYGDQRMAENYPDINFKL